MKELAPALVRSLGTSTRLPQHLPNIPVRPLNLPVGLRIVRRDSDPRYTVLLLQVLQSCSEGSSVVRDDFTQTAPPTDDVLEQPVRD